MPRANTWTTYDPLSFSRDIFWASQSMKVQDLPAPFHTSWSLHGHPRLGPLSPTASPSTTQSTVLVHTSHLVMTQPPGCDRRKAYCTERRGKQPGGPTAPSCQGLQRKSLRVAIGNKGEGGSSSSLWRVTVQDVVLSPATACHWVRVRHMSSRPCFLSSPCNRLPGKEFGSPPSQEASVAPQSPLLAFCSSPVPSLPVPLHPPPHMYPIYCIQWAFLTLCPPFLPSCSLHCCWTVVSSLGPTEDTLVTHTGVTVGQHSGAVSETLELIANF